MGVVVRRYIDILTIIINFPYSTCISSFLEAASLLLCSFLKCFFGLVVYRDERLRAVYTCENFSRGIRHDVEQRRNFEAHLTVGR